MKCTVIFFSLIALAHAESNWVMTKNSTPLSYYVEFNCLQEDALAGKVVRSGFLTPRYCYDLYSPEGTFLARAISRVLSLGVFCPNQMEFDIYDEMNGYVGYIGGKFWTKGTKFIFTNAAGLETGSALLSSDADQAIFSFLSSNNSIVATLEGKLSGDLSTWELNDVKPPLGIDARALKLFGAFISDFHDSFIRKPEIHNHTYIQQTK